MLKECCELCGASGVKLTKHHLIPQSKCRNKYSKLRNDFDNHLWICELCHRTIHAYFENNRLRDELNTKDALMNDERFSKYLEWWRKHLDYSSNSSKQSLRRS